MLFRKWWLKPNKIKAIHENDIEDFLSSIGMKAKIENSEIICRFCSKIITKDNIGAIIRRENFFEFTCDDFECISRSQFSKVIADE